MTDRSSGVRMNRYRDVMRRKGLRPVQLWVPDTRSRSFREKLSADIERINAADEADGMFAWLERVSMFDADEAG